MGIRMAAPARLGGGLSHSLSATTVTVGAPLAGVLGLSEVVDGPLSPLLVSFVAIGLAMAASTLGTAAWMRHPASDRVSFGELMLWCWLRRARSERELAAGHRELEQLGASSITPAARLHVLREMSAALDRKDPYTYGHSRRVERFAYRTGLALSLDAALLDVLRVAAAIHDVGKIHVPDEVLRKEGPLTDEEYTAIKAHAALGAEMVAHMGKAEITQAVRHHHERWDGRGYPDGVSGNDIPLTARVIGVVDAYDAMTSTRSYRSSLGRKRAIEILREEGGRQFDPEVVAAFLSTLSKPVALFLTFPAASVPSIARTIGQWFGRGSVGQIATGLGSVGMAIAISTSVALPGEAPASLASTASTRAATDQVLGTRIRAGRDAAADKVRPQGNVGPRSEKSRRDDRGSKSKSPSRARDGRKPQKPSGSTPVASGSSGGTASGTSGAGSTSAAPGTASTDPVGDVQEPVEEATQDPSQEWDPAADTDPQPERGEDCDGDVAATKGGAVHCGG